MALWQESTTSLAVNVYDANTGTWQALPPIPTGFGSADAQITFFAPHQALAVWRESNLDPNLTKDQLEAMPLENILSSQYLAYATWDGNSWSGSQALTTPSLGEGGVVLAACPSTDPVCPAGGAVTAVWERNTSADFNARQTRLFYATYQNGVWSQPQPVDATSNATDILPSVAYQGGKPVVAWVRDSDTDLTDVSSRHIRLRVLDGSPVSTPSGLPNSIAELSLIAQPNGNLLLAFTQAENSKQLLDNRRPLSLAEAICSGNSCTWSHKLLRDAFGRIIYAEHPQ
ncbi:MAG: hypothetical protein ACE5H9_17140, partial [Anaerolineae bacterium]